MDLSNNPFNPHPRPHPPPTPVPPPPSPHPHPHPRILLILLVSIGCLLLLGACLCAIWWIIKRRKEKKVTYERKNVDIDEHLRVQEVTVPGHCGKKKVMVSVDDDIRVHKDAHKNEVDKFGNGLRGEPKEGVAGAGGYSHNY